RRATKAQRQLLIARDGGCFACGAHPDICDAHHMRPVSQGGATSIDNMVLACWSCHNKIHHFGWQIHGPPDRRSLHPPEAAAYGPAYAPDSPRMFEAGAARTLDRPSLLGSGAARTLDRPSLLRSGTLDTSEPPMPAPLFGLEAETAPDPPPNPAAKRPSGQRDQSGGPGPPVRAGPAAARDALRQARASLQASR
ncbi:MAG: HNH endonuclease signature motif containing protein, partial [Acidimicrobiaceae bacterium]|nr:HNH endonuclease signature motif containing protein [Acidimicrobiaceae bacterium]